MTPLAGMTVLSFESRRAAEIAELIRRRGGTPVSAPSMREVPLADHSGVAAFVRELEGGAVDVVLFLTGVGTRALVAGLPAGCSVARFAALLAAPTVVARGPKPSAALRELGRPADFVVPEPNTWVELLATLDRHVALDGRRVAVQEYGRGNDQLSAGLRARGATVLPVVVYRWALPEDLAPLESAIRRIVDGGADALLFTSAQQVVHVVAVADRLGLAAALRRGAAGAVVGSVGPLCSESLRAHGFTVDIEPEHPKMGHLIAALAAAGPRCLAAKRSRA
jgi:uroporphyrinogen-III synthase